jgi:protein required for attachment to host cells
VVKASVTWVVVADGGRARLVARRESKPRYATLRELMSIAEQAPSRELGADKPGRSRESATTARHAIEPRSDPHELAKEAFAREIAKVLNEAGAAGAFDRIILAAPPHVAAALHRFLDKAVGAKIVGELPKDLTKIPDHELGRHLDEVASGSRRTGAS